MICSSSLHLGGARCTYNHAVERIGEVIDVAGVVIIVTATGVVISAGAAAVGLGHHESGVYRRFRRQLGRTILLGLEPLMVGDIVRTVAAEPSRRHMFL